MASFSRMTSSPSGGVDDFLGVRILDAGAGLGADSGTVALDGADNVDEEIGGANGALVEHPGTEPEGFVVVEDFLGVRGNIAAIGRKAAVEFVVSGEEVLDFRAGAGFLEGNGVEENGRIRQGVGAPFQLCQGAAGTGDGFEDRHRFQLGGWRKQREEQARTANPLLQWLRDVTNAANPSE